MYRVTFNEKKKQYREACHEDGCVSNCNWVYLETQTRPCCTDCKKLLLGKDLMLYLFDRRKFHFDGKEAFK